MEQASALWTYIIGVAWNSHRSGVPYAIWKKLSAVVPFGKDVADRIYEAKTVRNYLAHNYFWQHAADLLDPRKQESLIEELTAMANRFKKLDDELVRITDAYAYRMGMTEEQISHEEELLKSQDG